MGEKIRLQDFADDEKTKWRLKLSNESLFGTDWKERTAQACKMNMVVHGDGSAGIFLHHGLVDVPGVIEANSFDVCLTNPPFGSFENDPEVLKQYELGNGHSTQDRIILGMERALDLVRPGGRIGMITIDGVLNNQSMAYVRDHIRKRAHVLGVVSLNKETFEGYNARAKTSALFLEKRAENLSDDTNETRKTFFAVASNTGYAPNGSLIPGNELPDILNDFRDFIAGREPSIHPRTRVSRLEERMDAEYYVPASLAADVEFTATVETIRNDADRMLEQLAALEQEVATGLAGEMEVLLISDILEPSVDKVRVIPEQSYSLVGVKWWGGGTFLRETKLGKELSAKSLFRIHQGDLIYNRLFAYRGSFALVAVEHNECFVSNEFPTFRLKDARSRDPDLLMRYVVEYLNSPQMLAEVDRLSTGSTKQSRNRFYEPRFLNLPVRVPTEASLLSAAVQSFRSAAHLRRLSLEMAQRLEQVRKQIGAAMHSASLG